jgi:hypothetical protein
MAVFKPEIKETTEDRLQKAINLGREEALKEVLDWLDETTIDDADGCGHPIISFIGFDYKEQMLQLFKERFNIE